MKKCRYLVFMQALILAGLLFSASYTYASQVLVHNNSGKTVYVNACIKTPWPLTYFKPDWEWIHLEASPHSTLNWDPFQYWLYPFCDSGVSSSNGIKTNIVSKLCRKTPSGTKFHVAITWDSTSLSDCSTEFY